MTRFSIRAAVTTFVVAAALLVAGAVSSPRTAPATAAPASSCTSSSGVLVVVDFRRLGGGIDRGCDPSPTDGFDALHTAGFTTEGTQHDGPAFVCRINGLPTPSQDPCVRTPPASAYWSYWHAPRGATQWSYSSFGADRSTPEAGSIDAWVFGATDVGGTTGGPCFTPADARAGRSRSCPVAQQPAPRSSSTKAPAPARSATRSQRTGGGGARPGDPASSGPARSSAASSSAKAKAKSTASSASGSSGSSGASSAAPSSAPDSGVVTFGNASPAAGQASEKDTGSALPLVLVLLLVVALGAGAGFAALRRRRLSE